MEVIINKAESQPVELGRKTKSCRRYWTYIFYDFFRYDFRSRPEAAMMSYQSRYASTVL